MTFDEAIDALAVTEAVPAEAMQWLLDHWERSAPACRALLHDYVTGQDESERTTRALFFVIHLLGERGDEACFPMLCRLLHDPERADLVLGDDALAASMPCILVSTFDGVPEHLYALVNDAETDEVLRGDALLVLAYAARTQRMSESALYDYLAALPDTLQPRQSAYVWFGWASAVAMLGFAGLAAQAEAIIRDGLVDEDLMTAGDFWDDLNEARAHPGEMAGPAWELISPMGSAIDFLLDWSSEADDGEPDYAPPEPVRNPLRNVGRNDPCPCGSGKKYKKCCLAA